MNLKRKNDEFYMQRFGKEKRLHPVETQVLKVKPGNLQKFDVNFPHFRQPCEIGEFSLDIQRKFYCDKSQLKIFIKPRNFDDVHFDLTQGYHTMVRKDDSEKTYIRLDNVLRWIIQKPEKFELQGCQAETAAVNNNQRMLHTDFICWRGLITKLLCTPYENREGWKIAVTLYNGTYYMCEFHTDEKIQREQNKSERDDQMCCWGWKFEQYLTAGSPDGEPDTQSPYNNIEAFCTVVRSRLQSHSLVFAGEVDAVDVDKVSGKQHYVEFKTTREPSHPRQHSSFKRYKLIKWWAQSFLVGIPEIVCGYRDDDGIVHRLETLQTQKIPEIVKSEYKIWKPNVCFNFLDQFLLEVKSHVTEDNHRQVYLLEWYPRGDVSCTKLPLDTEEYRFLPDWYTNT